MFGPADGVSCLTAPMLSYKQDTMFWMNDDLP